MGAKKKAGKGGKKGKKGKGGEFALSVDEENHVLEAQRESLIERLVQESTEAD